MKALVQRVARCCLSVGGQEVSRIDAGLICYLGVGSDDSPQGLDWLAKKVARLRVFPDGEGRMNRSVVDEGLAILVVPQFTLYGDIRNGYRPSFSAAAAPAVAERMYEAFREALRGYGVVAVAGGVFGADMTIEQVNRGPVTILLETPVTRMSSA